MAASVNGIGYCWLLSLTVDLSNYFYYSVGARIHIMDGGISVHTDSVELVSFLDCHLGKSAKRF